MRRKNEIQLLKAGNILNPKILLLLGLILGWDYFILAE